MWNPLPYIQALAQNASPCVRNDPALADFISEVVFKHGERRPEFIVDVHDEIITRPRGFVYDRGSGLIFMGGWADHELTAACLMTLRLLRAPMDLAQASEQPLRRHGPLAEQYLEDGYGFIANSPILTATSGSWPLNVGTEVMLSAQEKQWFRTLDTRYC